MKKIVNVFLLIALSVCLFHGESVLAEIGASGTRGSGTTAFPPGSGNSNWMLNGLNRELDKTSYLRSLSTNQLYDSIKKGYDQRLEQERFDKEWKSFWGGLSPQQ